MNIEKANAIPLPEILNKLGKTPDKTKGNDLWYKSPFRYEKTASFKINTLKKTFGTTTEKAKAGMSSILFAVTSNHKEKMTP